MNLHEMIIAEQTDEVIRKLYARIKELEEGLIKIKCLPAHSDSILSSFQIADELLAKESEG